MYGKLFASMYDGTLGTKGPWQALVTFQQLIILGDRKGVVDMTAEAIAKRTSIPLDIIVTGLRALEQPDDDSRSKLAGGRRIVRLDPDRSWGWQIVNHEHYRNLRTSDDRRDYQRDLMRERRGVDRTVEHIVSTPVSTPLADLAYADAEASTKAVVGTDPTGIQPTKKGKSVEPTSDSTSVTATTSSAARLPSTRGPRTAAAIATRVSALFATIHDTSRARLSAEQERDVQAEMVFLYWASKFNHPGAILDRKRQTKLVQRLKENGGNVSELLYALDGAYNDPWTMGKAQGSERAYDDIVTIFRDRAQVERFASTRKKYKEGLPHPLIPKLEAALRGEGTVREGGE
jgi:hypothetical protein